jgi:hypothetical protein
LKNRPHVIENPAALNLGGGFRTSKLFDFTSGLAYDFKIMLPARAASLTTIGSIPNKNKS